MNTDIKKEQAFMVTLLKDTGKSATQGVRKPKRSQPNWFKLIATTSFHWRWGPMKTQSGFLFRSKPPLQGS